MANRGKLWQIADVIRSKIVVETGVCYYRCPCVTLDDLECIGVGAGRHTGSCQSTTRMILSGFIASDLSKSLLYSRELLISIKHSFSKS